MNNFQSKISSCFPANKWHEDMPTHRVLKYKKIAPKLWKLLVQNPDKYYFRLYDSYNQKIILVDSYQDSSTNYQAIKARYESFVL